MIQFIKSSFSKSPSVDQEIESWIASLAHSGRSTAHIQNTSRRVRRLCQAGGLETLSQLSQYSDWLGLAQSLGLSVGSTRAYLQSIKQYGLYLRSKGLVSGDASVLVVKAPSVREADQDSHALLDDQDVEALMTMSGSAPHRHCLSATQRRFLYMVLATTGLRMGEAQSLTKRDLKDGGVVVKAQNTKNRRSSFIPIPDWVLEAGQAYLATLAPEDLIWPRKSRIRGGEMMREDLEYLGIDHARYDGIVSPHGLRVWFTTKLASNPEVSFRTVMQLARHSTPDLTARVYARVGEGQKRQAVTDTFSSRPALTLHRPQVSA